MKKIYWLGLVLVIVFDILYNISTTAYTPTTENDFKILLKSREFIPNQGIESGLKSKIENTSLERIHILIQFYDRLNSTEREMLNSNGVTLLSYIPKNAYFASVPSSLNSIQQVIDLPFVRWVGDILPEDKIDPSILEKGVGSWAKNPDRTVNLIVVFFKDISLDDAKKVIRGYGGIVRRKSTLSNSLTVTISKDKINSLANHNSVQWVEEIPGPPTTFNDATQKNIFQKIWTFIWTFIIRLISSII